MNVSNTLLEVNKENIFLFLSPHDIYKYYLNNKIVYNKAFSSPFRVDKKPSFLINTKFVWKDFTTGEYGDCFSFVKKLYNITYYESLVQIINDLNINNKFIFHTKFKSKSTKKLEIKNISNRKSLNGQLNLKIKTRDFEQYDYDYWNCQGISLKYLKIGNVYAISHYFINGVIYIAEKYAYAYMEKKDGIITYKIYQPFSSMRKWINGSNYSVWELWNLLPKKHDKLIITSSRKDALSIIENIKIPSTAFQAEMIWPKKHIMQSILNRFKQVYLLYDNDYSSTTNWGQKQAQKMLKEYSNTINLVIPEEYKSKDFSELVCNHSRTFASNLIKEML